MFASRLMNNNGCKNILSSSGSGIVTGGADGDVGKASGGSVCFPTQGTTEGRVSREDAGSSHLVGLPSASHVV